MQDLNMKSMRLKLGILLQNRIIHHKHWETSHVLCFLDIFELVAYFPFETCFITYDSLEDILKQVKFTFFKCRAFLTMALLSIVIHTL